MSIKQIEFTQVWENYWMHVQRHEQDIRENMHRGKLPPDLYGYYWEEKFEAVYRAIRPSLGKLCKEKFYAVPPGLASRPTPIKAENGPHALMIYLNPSIELEGESGALDSAEYKAIKAAAMSDFQRRDDARFAKTRSSVCTRGAKTKSQLIELRGVIIDQHFPRGKPFRKTTLTGAEIQARFGWSQSTVSNKMKELFKGLRGMAAYAAVFGTHTTDKGFHERFEDAALSVEAIWEDKRPEDNDDDEDDIGMACPILK